MLCPRCQSDNKPGLHTCWNCLSPLEGTLAQQFAQKAPDPAAAGAATAQKNKGSAFWAGMGVVSFVLFVGSLLFFWNLSTQARKALPADAQPAASTPTAAPDTSASGATTGAATAGAATSGATTDTSGSSSTLDSSSTTGGASSDSAGAAGGKGALSSAMKDANS